MPKEMTKYCNPQKAFTSIESHIVIRKRLKSLQREGVLEKEMDWDGGMKKLIEDFPYEKDLNKK